MFKTVFTSAGIRANVSNKIMANINMSHMTKR